MGVCNCSIFCCTLLYVHSSIAIILMGKRELIALLNLSSWCLVMVERLFLAVPGGCLQFVIVVFPDHTHLLYSLTCTRGDSTCTGDIQLKSRSEGQCTHLVSSLQMTLEKACSDTENFLAASGDRTWLQRQVLNHQTTTLSVDLLTTNY